MLRIHLAQIFYNLAYYDSPVDYLEEPCFLAETETPIGKLRSVNQIENFLSNSKRSYIEHLRNKLRDIVCWSGERKAHLLVFPEYSVPFQLLSDMQRLARQYSMTIVAGTHRVVSSSLSE